MDYSHEKLRRALYECMEKDLSFVPKDSEIRKEYTPSKDFQRNMQKIIRKVKRHDFGKVIIKNRNKFYYLVAAAAIFILGIQIVRPDFLIDDNNNDMAVQFDSSSSIATTETEESLMGKSADSPTDDQVVEKAEEKSQVDVETWDLSWNVSTISDTNVTLVLVNDSSQDCTYTNITSIDKLIDNNWINVYSKEVDQEQMLLKSAKVEESISLDDYNMKESGSYRLYRIVNGKQIELEIVIP